MLHDPLMSVRPRPGGLSEALSLAGEEGSTPSLATHHPQRTRRSEVAKHEKKDEFESMSGDLMDGRGPFEPVIPAEPKKA